MNEIYILSVFVISIAIMIVMISKWNVHPAITLLLVVIGLGFAIGLNGEKTMSLLTKGFGDTIGKVGLLFFLGCVLGKLLESTGAAIKITNFMYKVFGKKNAIWAIAVASAILGIPILADTIVIVLIPIISNLAVQTGASMAQYGTVLYLGAYVTASAVPPTPGPLAAAAFLNLDLSQAIIWGILISIPGIFAGTLYTKYLNIPISPKEEFLSKNTQTSKISLFQSLAPIILPILLIMLSSLFSNMETINPNVKEFFKILGNPIVAMLIAITYSLSLTGTRWKTKEVLNDWVETGLRLAAMPIIVTGLGGSLALIIKDTKVAESIANSIAGLNIPAVLIPFTIAALVNTITGSNTLGVLTGAAIIEPMLGTLNLSPLAAYLACATGAQVFKHSNSSGFWVTVSLSNMDLGQGLKSVGAATAISGFTSGIVVLILDVMNLI
ncbi:GntP family permease [Lonepinella sp. BR2930]|uniref:GntP family permease n=1 Tax=Lonepinella sp. BR2930 TaxID=3434554 RepID=UPI003F6DFA1B